MLLRIIRLIISFWCIHVRYNREHLICIQYQKLFICYWSISNRVTHLPIWDCVPDWFDKANYWALDFHRCQTKGFRNLIEKHSLCTMCLSFSKSSFEKLNANTKIAIVQNSLSARYSKFRSITRKTTTNCTRETGMLYINNSRKTMFPGIETIPDSCRMTNEP